MVFEPPSGTPRVIGTVRAGEYFGEMALLTGEARSATVIAKTDVECYRLDRASFQELLAARPEIVDEVKRTMGTRRSDLDTVRAEFAKRGNGDEERVQHRGMLGRLRRLLGLGA